ncbi:MAG: arginase [Phenylobacterium sp.]|uniref:hypothetical protein n=1 Tax=Phenylobacterium sp. TaxID=1871053 RepID=UPI0025D36126|nr:hypothetical protein [Phenylobacterium sp.]MBT9470830.1 arginase [Phenylobacterium sp.]
MQAALLHLDDALIPQVRLREAVGAGGGRVLDWRDLGPELRLWAREGALQRLRLRLAESLPIEAGAALVFSGSGDFHHITPLLLARAIAAAGMPPVTVVHFDNHPDWVRFGPGLHCGSWVGRAARLPHVAKVVTVGVCSGDLYGRALAQADLDLVIEDRVELYAYGSVEAPTYGAGGREWPTIAGLGEPAFAAFLQGRIGTHAVYITIDKDVLCADEAGTNWDQGRTSLGSLSAMVEGVAAGRYVIGADVVGDWSSPAYGGGLLNALQKRGEAALDQPWRAPPAAVRAANEGVNLRLFELLQGVSA